MHPTRIAQPAAAPLSPPNTVGSGGMGGIGSEMEATIKENEDKSATLHQAKDRAQMTATTAMSVVNVALLKECLTAEEGTKFHYVTLYLISVCLALQITVGLISLFVSHLRSYYTKTRDDLCEDVFENMCCCKIIARDGGHHHEMDFRSTLALPQPPLVTHQAERSGKASLEVPEFTGSSRPNKHRRFDHDGCSSCCPWEFTTSTLPEFEREIIHKYDHLCDQFVDVELDAMEASIQLNYIIPQVEEASRKLQDLEARKDATKLDEFEKEAAEIRQTLDLANAKKAIYERYTRELQVVESKGNILRHRVDHVRKNKMLKTVVFWQNLMNYMLYIVFILNVFITGLWMTDSETGGATGTKNTSMTLAPPVKS